MLKKRVIAVLVVKDNIVVQSIGFRKYLPVGKPEIAVEFFTQWGIDEIILLDITASRMRRKPNFAMVRSIAKQCSVPLTVGGGITCLSDIHELMHCGADKVSFNQAAFHSPGLIAEAARIFGDQSVVVSIDVQKSGNDYHVYDYFTGQLQVYSPFEYATRIQAIGAGEILLNSVDRDGMKCGFDLELINAMSQTVKVPLIVCGGAGVPAHFLEVFDKTIANAFAAANFFHFFEHSITITKAVISQNHVIRHESHVLYQENILDFRGRLMKKQDDILEKLFYLKIQKQEI